MSEPETEPIRVAPIEMLDGTGKYVALRTASTTYAFTAAQARELALILLEAIDTVEAMP